MVQIYFIKMNNSTSKINKISTKTNIFLSFFHLQPILYRKSPADKSINWTFFKDYIYFGFLIKRILHSNYVFPKTQFRYTPTKKQRNNKCKNRTNSDLKDTRQRLNPTDFPKDIS